jgi:[ribosomal protein S5]-alanine N-acetyltransferase
MPSRELHSARLFFRPPRRSDAAAIFESYASDPEVVRYLSWPAHESVEDTEKFMAESKKMWDSKSGYPWLLLHRETGDLIGMIAMHLDEQINIGYVIARPHWGQGYATEALKCVLEEAFLDPAVERVQALCDVENLGSARVLEKAGMVFEGTLRSIGVHPNRSPEPRDARIYSMVRRDLER